jgi:hypothetical protein
MANGDAAAAAGLAVFASTQDIREGYDNDNIRGDELAQHLTAGTHPASAIISGTLSTARLPVIPISKGGTGATSLTADGILTVNGTGTAVTTVAKITTSQITGYGTGTWTGTVAAGGNAVSGGNAVFSGSVSSAGGFTGGNVNIGGNAVTCGNFVNSGTITSPASRNTISGSWNVLYINADGVLGIPPSTRRVKQDIVDAQIDPEKVAQIRLVNFRYKTDVKEQEDKAPIQLGLIAEELHDLGLTDFIYYDDKDRPAGVHYERLALALIPLVQNHEERLKALEEKVK